MRGDTGFPVRLRFSKRGKVRFVSHRDLARGFERAFRVARLPLTFTQGFSPRPKVSLGLALGVGHESDAEYLDLELREAVDLDALPELLGAALPVGVTVDGAVELAPRAPALQEAVTTVEYHLCPAALRGSTLHDAVARALDAGELPVQTTRKGRSVVEDLRPGLRHLEVLDDRSLHAEVATKPRGIRPSELLGALSGLVADSAPVAGEDRVLRTTQWIERDGARHEPLAADRARDASHDARTSKGLIDVGRHDHARPGPEHLEPERRGSGDPAGAPGRPGAEGTRPVDLAGARRIA